jgi:23S rRNA pseudouridine2605 synthase
MQKKYNSGKRYSGTKKNNSHKRDESPKERTREGNQTGGRFGKERREKTNSDRTDSRPPRRDERKSYSTGRDSDRRNKEAGRKPYRSFDKSSHKEDSYGDDKKRYEGKGENKNKSWSNNQSNRSFSKVGSFKKKWKPHNIKKAFADPKTETSITPAAGLSTIASQQIRLNKYLSNAGICSRREADKFITAGVITVNGKIITELGYKVNPDDKIQFGGNKVNKDKPVYILLNKPKGYITTCDDPKERDTVMDLMKEVKERIYPVGRLDRHTTGLLLLTNDGDLAKNLMHPKYQVAKVYHVELDKPFRPDDFDKLKEGVELEDGFIKPDDLAYVEGAKTRKEIGIEIHSGKNRIVRRIFESLGYIVIKLDRVLYAGLTKKTLSRGKWRHLADNEVRMLKRKK